MSHRRRHTDDSERVEHFVWKKKERLEKRSKRSNERDADPSEKRRAMQLELDRIEQRRQERQRFFEDRERQRDMERLERDKAAMGNWAEREALFELEQAKKKARIRIREGRALPVDIIAVNLLLFTDTELASSLEADNLDVDAESPLHLIRSLSVPKLEQLLRDIEPFAKLEKDRFCKEFWRVMQVCCRAEISERAMIDNGYGDELASTEMRASVSAMSLEELQDILSRKGVVSSGSSLPNSASNAEYIEQVLVAEARILLEQMHRQIVDYRVQQSSSHGTRKKKNEADSVAKQVERIQQRLLTELSSLETLMEKRAAIGRPERLSDDEVQLMIEGFWSATAKPGGCVYEESESRRTIEKFQLDLLSDKLGVHVMRKGDVPEGTTSEELLESSFRRQFASEEAERIAAEASGQAYIPSPGNYHSLEQTPDDEFTRGPDQQFTGEVDVHNQQKFSWADKYRPRKPRYFNRIRTTFEWNQYNRTHYDKSNPPPKVVQGYCFNIFYPDLVDKSVTPTYKIERDEGWPDTAVLRFSAGPPYEDVAFRILNKEWEKGRHKGFRCVFDRGTLQLQFRFKRHIYRR